MRVLALNPYGAGSHRAFFTGWAARSRHAWTVVELPGWNWKWRMRYGAVELAERVTAMVEEGGAEPGWDAVVCTDMMNAAEWRGLVPAGVGRLPLVVYFHENQAGYPVDAERGADARDVHFVLTNLVSAAAADEAWFNSAHNLETLVGGLEGALQSVPGVNAREVSARVCTRARVEAPGVDDALFEVERARRGAGALRVLWAARSEFDKRPEVFARAMERLAERGVEFVVDVLGGERREMRNERREEGAAGVLERMRERLGSRVGRFGWAESREDYVKALSEADAIVSTAAHEFFGLAVVEAVAAGARAVVPRGLAYPEVLGEGPWVSYHDGSVEGLVGVLEALAGCVSDGVEQVREGRSRVERYRWSVRAAAMDARFERVAGGG